MKKFLKKKFSSPMLLLVLVLAVLVTGIVVYTVTATSLKQTTTDSQASGSSCSAFCSQIRASNKAECVTTCEEVKTGESTCTDLCSYARASNSRSCNYRCGSMVTTPVEAWCDKTITNTTCPFGPGGQGYCTAMCVQVNSGSTCTQVCDGQFPSQGGTTNPNNAKCKAVCPGWIMPVPSPLPVTEP